MEEDTSAVKAALTAALGSIYEWYDFAVYGYLASDIAANFFGAIPLTVDVAMHNARRASLCIINFVDSLGLGAKGHTWFRSLGTSNVMSNKM